jgi:hypothetical protein
MHVFQTAGVPPSTGSSIFAIMGWTEKSSAELTNIVSPNKSVLLLYRLAKDFIACFAELSGNRDRKPVWNR